MDKYEKADAPISNIQSSARLFLEAADQSKEASNHAQNIFKELGGWVECSIHTEETVAKAFQQGLNENVTAVGDSIKHTVQKASSFARACGEELKHENPDLVSLMEGSRKLPSLAAHRIHDFYKAHPLTAVLETVLFPPVVIIDGLMRGGKTDQHELCKVETHKDILYEAFVQSADSR